MASPDSLSLAAAITLALTACGTTTNSRYCDEETPCLDPATPFCDVIGELSAAGNANTCVALPFDASPESVTLTVELDGTGVGSVTSVNGSLECSASPCEFEVEFGSELILEASTSEGSTFVTWSGACEGFRSCALQASEALTVAATFEPQGSVLWKTRPQRGPNAGSQLATVLPKGIATNSHDEIVVAGGLIGTPNFGGGALISGDASEGTLEAFVVQYNAKGEHIWSHAYSGLGFSDDSMHDVAVDSSDNVVLVGDFEDPIDFGGATTALSGTVFNRFLARLDRDGEALSAVEIAGNSATSFATLTIGENDEAVSGVANTRFDWHDTAGTLLRSLVPLPEHGVPIGSAIDGQGRIMMGGTQGRSIDFAPEAPGGTLGDDMGLDSYIVKLNADASFHSGKSLNLDNLGCLASDAAGDGSYYIAGSFSASVDLGGTVITPMSSRDGFVAKFSNTHALLWSVHLPSSGFSVVSSCALDVRGDLIVGGSYAGDVRLAPSAAVHTTKAGSFFAKYAGDSGELVWETMAVGITGIIDISSDSVGRINAAVQLTDTDFTIGGETVPADAIDNLLVIQLAP